MATKDPGNWEEGEGIWTPTISLISGKAGLAETGERGVWARPEVGHPQKRQAPRTVEPLTVALRIPTPHPGDRESSSGMFVSFPTVTNEHMI